MMLLAINYVYTSKDEDSTLTKEVREFREELKEHLEMEFLKVFPDSKVPYFMEKVISSKFQF